jgi:hypothetical protein
MLHEMVVEDCVAIEIEIHDQQPPKGAVDLRKPYAVNGDGVTWFIPQHQIDALYALREQHRERGKYIAITMLEKREGLPNRVQVLEIIPMVSADDLNTIVALPAPAPAA